MKIEGASSLRIHNFALEGPKTKEVSLRGLDPRTNLPEKEIERLTDFITPQASFHKESIVGNNILLIGSFFSIFPERMDKDISGKIAEAILHYQNTTPFVGSQLILCPEAVVRLVFPDQFDRLQLSPKDVELAVKPGLRSSIPVAALLINLKCLFPHSFPGFLNEREGLANEDVWRMLEIDISSHVKNDPDSYITDLAAAKLVFPEQFHTVRPTKRMVQSLQENARVFLYDSRLYTQIANILHLAIIAADRAWVDETGLHLENDEEPFESAPPTPLPILRAFITYEH